MAIPLQIIALVTFVELCIPLAMVGERINAFVLQAAIVNLVLLAIAFVIYGFGVLIKRI